MAEKTISELEQITELLSAWLLPIEGADGNTSSVSLGQIYEFLHANIIVLPLSGSAPSYTVNPSVNSVYTLNLSTLNASDTVQINLPSGLVLKEAQIILKIKNPNSATITIPGLAKRLSQFNLSSTDLQMILDYDQVQSAWVGGTLTIESI